MSPEIFVVSPENVVELALLAVRRDRARIVPGMAMSFLAVLICVTPMFILRLFLTLARFGCARRKILNRGKRKSATSIQPGGAFR